MEYLVLLRNLGFTEYEARVYLALSRLGVATAREITWDSKLPKNKVYEMLGRLERDNKIVTLPVSPRKYKIVDPNKLKEVVDQKKETINDIGTQLDRFLKFVSLPQRNEFKEFFWVIKGQDAIIDRIAEETRKIQRESFGVMRHLRAPPKTIRLSREAIERGAKIKLISLWDSSIVDAVRKWEAIGAEVRVYDEKKWDLSARDLVYLIKKVVELRSVNPK